MKLCGKRYTVSPFVGVYGKNNSQAFFAMQKMKLPGKSNEKLIFTFLFL